MKVTFEHPTIIFDDKIAEIIIEFVNHILYADREATLRQIVADFTPTSTTLTDTLSMATAATTYG